MKRNIWESITKFVHLGSYPLLDCPYCGKNSLKLNEDTLSSRTNHNEKATPLLQKERNAKIESLTELTKDNIFFGVLAGIHVAVQENNIYPAKFICFFTCSECENDVAASGTAKFRRYINTDKNDKNPQIKVEYFSPPLPIFQIPKGVPQPVRDEILQAFNHFHSDLSSSGSKLRRSIEKLCAELGFQEKNLHASICAMAKKYPDESSLLESLKLLGNEATHSDNINEQDLLNAFEVQHFVLNLFERARLEKKAKEQAKKLTDKFSKKNLSS